MAIRCTCPKSANTCPLHARNYSPHTKTATETIEERTMRTTATNDCQFDGFFCTAHACGVAADGAIRPCGKPGCPHCGKGKAERPVNKKLALKRLAQAQRALERWEPRLARACAKVIEARAEVRRQWKKLEDAGVHVDPMDPEVQKEADDGGE